MQAAEFLYALAQDDIDAAAGQIRGHGDGAALAGAGDEQRFGFFVASVEDVVRDIGHGGGHGFGGFDVLSR